MCSDKYDERSRTQRTAGLTKKSLRHQVFNWRTLERLGDFTIHELFLHLYGKVQCVITMVLQCYYHFFKVIIHSSMFLATTVMILCNAIKTKMKLATHKTPSSSYSGGLSIYLMV